MHDTTADQPETSAKISPIEIARMLWQYRVKITVSALAFVILMTGISFLLPKYYRSTTTILPASSESGMIGNLSSIASLAGISVKETPIQDLVPFLVNSEIVLKEVIYTKYYSVEKNTSVTLIEYWEIHEDSALAEYEVALKKMRETIEVSSEKKSGTVSISLLMKEPVLAADVVKKMAETVDNFLRERRMTSASEQRKWIESRIKEVEQELRTSENSLEDFRRKNRSISNAPELLLQQQRLIREVEINSVIYQELRKQFELARIEEVKNIPVITVIDDARPAAKKEKPQKSFIVLMSAAVGFLGAALYFLGGTIFAVQIRSFKSIFVKQAI